MKRPTTGGVFVALGSNMGDRSAHLSGAVAALSARPRVRVVRASPVYETAAHTLAPGERQPPYLNAVLELGTALTPEALLDVCHAVERAAGRDRSTERRWGPRPLDVDLLVCGAEVRPGPGLVLPHPRLAERRFVLRPFADLAPGLVVPPPFERTVAALLAACPDDDVPARTDLVLPVP